MDRLPRIDYLELSRRVPMSYIDYGAVRPAMRVADWLESRLRLDVRLALLVARLAREQRYDAVFSMSERVGIPLIPLLPHGIRHHVWLHHPLSRPKLRLLQMARMSERWSTALALSEAERDAFRHRLGLEWGHARPLRYHVDTRFFQPRPANTAADQRFVLSLGLSCRDYRTLVRAVRTLPEIPVRIHVGSSWVTGNPGLDGALPPNLQVGPFVQPSMLRGIYRASRFVVVPLQRTTQWSAGCTTVLQAQAMGKPVITTRTPSMSEYVLDGETGLLVEPGSPAALAEAIASLWSDPEKVAAMGRRARQWIEGGFSLDRWLDEVTGLLEGA
jgi:glycosyltransferase involved in cell wall biosynthesis